MLEHHLALSDLRHCRGVTAITCYHASHSRFVLMLVIFPRAKLLATASSLMVHVHVHAMHLFDCLHYCAGPSTRQSISTTCTIRNNPRALGPSCALATHPYPFVSWLQQIRQGAVHTAGSINTAHAAISQCNPCALPSPALLVGATVSLDRSLGTSVLAPGRAHNTFPEGTNLHAMHGTQTCVASS